jgi:hypothetical protein
MKNIINTDPKVMTVRTHLLDSEWGAMTDSFADGRAHESTGFMGSGEFLHLF